MAFEGTYQHIFSLRERILKHTKPDGKAQRLPLDADSILVVIVEVAFGSGLQLDESCYYINPMVPFSTLTSLIRTKLGDSDHRKLVFTVQHDLICGSTIMRTLPGDPDGGLYVVVSNRMRGDHQVFSGEGRLLRGVAWVEGDDDSVDPDYQTQPDWLSMLTTDTAQVHRIDKRATHQHKRDSDAKRKPWDKATADAQLAGKESSYEDSDFGTPATNIRPLPTLNRQNANEGILSASDLKHTEHLQKDIQLVEGVGMKFHHAQYEGKDEAQLAAKDSIAKALDVATPARAMRPLRGLIRPNANEGIPCPGCVNRREQSQHDMEHWQSVGMDVYQAQYAHNLTNDETTLGSADPISATAGIQVWAKPDQSRMPVDDCQTTADQFGVVTEIINMAGDDKEVPIGIHIQNAGTRYNVKGKCSKD